MNPDTVSELLKRIRDDAPKETIHDLVTRVCPDIHPLLTPEGKVIRPVRKDSRAFELCQCN